MNADPIRGPSHLLAIVCRLASPERLAQVRVPSGAPITTGTALTS
jgi:hypothetical protein